MAKLTKEAVMKRVKADDVALVDLEFTDYLGAIKSVTIPAHKLEDTLAHGCWFDGSSIEGFARIQEADMFLMPDPATYAVIPWRSGEGATARLICDVYKPDGKPFVGDPRYILKKVMAEADKMGFTFNTGPELEFFMFPRTEDGDIEFESKGNGYYFSLAMDESYEIRREIVAALETFGVTVEASHYEVGEKQHEIDFKYADAVTSADSAITLKQVVKNVANLYRYHATFMPKPMFGMNGSGMHTHMSLADKATGKNKFYDKKDPYGLSETAYYFMGGLLKHVREISALIAPTVNSYKRLTPGYEAPCYVCWARQNRSALIRVPAVRAGAEAATRVELRCPDPSANPYLAFAAMLKAGLQGIKDKTKVMKPVEEDVFEYAAADLKKHSIGQMPASLKEAIDEMEKSTLVRDLLGDYTYERYLATKKAEWDNFRLAVTDWEVERYLEDV
jgi:glutamine synthetase